MSTESTIAGNLTQITDRIRQFEEQSQQHAGSVRLLAVSKRKPAEMIRIAAAHGQLCFGENYAEEGASKREELGDLNLEWHYIGHIQSNKTRLISGTYDWVQSVDREKIAQRLSAHRPPEMSALNICIQVNIDAEASKSGCSADDLANLAASVASLDNLVLRGIMAIPAPQSDMAEQRRVFRKLHDLYLQLKSDYPTVDTLSMGMTGDMEAAIVEGATMVRIGTAIFGQRD
jgi:pyridoxal phosphate enzyme (YggS family)